MLHFYPRGGYNRVLMQNQPIVLKGVRVHNLKGVDLTIEPGELVVFTGVSGSGKSSLAFDTIYVEGQRRYIESLSHQARRFLTELPRPDADHISGIAPTIAIEQKLSGRTPRSTVGTMTGIYDCLRILFARIGIPHCPVSGEPVAAQAKEKITAQVLALPPKTKIYVLAPYAKGKKGEFKEEFAELTRRGFLRLRVDGAWVDEAVELDPKVSHDVDIVVDRLTVDDVSRVKEAVHNALELGKGFFSIYLVETQEEILFSQFAHSVKSGLSYGPLEPHDFSFNHPAGMCPTCHGLGVYSEFDLAKIIQPELSIGEDCCAIASSADTVRYGNIYRNLARLHKFDLTTPWKKLPEGAKKVFLYGVEQKWTRMIFTHPEKKTRWFEYVRWPGVLHEARERLNSAKSDLYRKKMGELMAEQVCPACLGSKIKPYPSAAQLGGKKIHELTHLSLKEALSFFHKLKLTSVEEQIGGELIKEVKDRLQFLLNVGLSYLSLERTSPTLSGGEAQRVRLASQIGAGLVGAIYILDEPSIGLHPTDHHKLIGTLDSLRNQGNTILVVEHDAETIFAADRVVDVGPGAGALGGRILAQQTVQELMKNPESITGGYLSGRLSIEIPKKRRKATDAKIEIVNATHNNLKNLSVSIPLGLFVCVTGVSGSGKSSLIVDTLYPMLLKGVPHVDKVIAVDQSPIGRTPRSNAATYIKLFDEIRDLFAELPESKLRGFTAGHFSFNVKEGSCPYCEGLGQVKIDMDFMEDAWIDCLQCKGKRFDPEILGVQFKGHSIHDVLSSDVEGALKLFEAIPSIRKKLEVLHLVGLHYLRLGQPSTTLSGGEAQRIKLAKELVRPATGKTVYILDEPTTGLHFHDIRKLLAVLQQLVDRGNTVIAIEHNMDFAKTADWLIDLGPGPGDQGGELVGQGTPEQVAKLPTLTGEALRAVPAPLKRKKRALGEATDIVIQNASQNNLRSISLSIPRGKISIFSGPSGSGKSSLAFDTLYAEGQRRYTETLPAYARSLIKALPKPKVDRIEGLSPSIALEQKTGGLNPRSTVGTMTEIYDLLRVLYAHVGVAYSPETGKPIRHISKETVIDRILALPQGEKIQVLAPLLRKESFEQLGKQGFLRVRLNGVIYELDGEIPLESTRKNELFLVIDRLIVDPKNQKRLFEAVEKATQRTEGVVVVAREKEDLFFNLAFSDESTGQSYPAITPQTFSFNHESGMCLECQGLGSTYGAHLGEQKDVLKRSISGLMDQLFKDKTTSGAESLVSQYFKAAGINCDTPLKDLSPEQRNLVFNGGPEKQLKKGFTLSWVGVQTALAKSVRMATGDLRESLLPLMKASPCGSCQGSRLNPLARHVRIRKVSLPALCEMRIDEAREFIRGVQCDPFLQETHDQIGKYLDFLISIGVTYLSLSRSAPTLSGGELQRIRLARQLGSGLTSCLYILDEPTIGLHPFDNERLNIALKRLRDLGNTLILVEHDPMTLQIADRIFDFGPKAGREGGLITAEGSLAEILDNAHSLTGAYLSGRKSIPIPQKRRPFGDGIEIENASLHNLDNVSVKIPYNAITCITGVSGSGKSTLMRHLLKPAAEKTLTEYKGARFQGLKVFDKVICIDQSPIGQTARADVSTYTDIQPLIRGHFAALPLAQAKGLRPSNFSPNHLRGMCRTCWGLGYKTVDLQFLPSVRVECDTCRGCRLNAISLEVRYKEKHFGEILRMTISEAILWFEAIPRIAKRLQLLLSVGLGYLSLGQELASLSGGEAQRLRLSRELAKRSSGNTLYLIDEPTVGLHTDDIAKLLPIFHRLADDDNTLVIIEHNVDVMVNADYIIDIDDGKVVAKGTPEEVMRSKKSRTAKYILERIEKKSYVTKKKGAP